jgi:hypothetical protein
MQRKAHAKYTPFLLVHHVFQGPQKRPNKCRNVVSFGIKPIPSLIAHSNLFLMNSCRKIGLVDGKREIVSPLLGMSCRGLQRCAVKLVRAQKLRVSSPVPLEKVRAMVHSCMSSPPCAHRAKRSNGSSLRVRRPVAFSSKQTRDHSTT